jgi:outer membrane lipoprotein-sorting protein
MYTLHDNLRNFSALFIIACLFLSTPAMSQETVPQEEKTPTGDEIMKKVRANEYSETMNASIQMALIDKNGKQQIRRFNIQRHGDNVLIRFLDPPDIKDTGYLIIKDDDGNQLIYVYFPPPTDDYRQINVEDEGGGQSFLGSDFDITDFQIKNPEDTANLYMKTQTVAGIECYVVESTPKDKEYKYSKTLTWVRTDYWLPIRIQFFDKNNEVAKEMRVLKFKTVGEKKIISKSEMANKTNKHKTVLEIEEVEFDVKFPDDNFTIRRLAKP